MAQEFIEIPADTRVLVFEDDAALRKMVVEVLTLEGCEVESTGKFDEVQRHLAEGEPFHVVLTDYNIRGLTIDGVAAISGELTREDAHNKHQHTQVLASSAQHQVLKDLSALGAVVDILPKPYDISQLVSKVGTLAAKSMAQASSAA